MQGFTDIDWMLYINDALGYRWGYLTYILYTGFALFIAGVTGNRYATHILCVGYLIFTIISFELGIFEQIRFGFGLVPGIEGAYSEINKYGIFSVAADKYFFMWAVLTIAMIITGIGLWLRGTRKSIFERISHAIKLHKIGLAVIAACLLIFFSLQAYIIKNVNNKRNFILSKQIEQETALYEKI
jgi:hypothetical protein